MHPNQMRRQNQKCSQNYLSFLPNYCLNSLANHYFHPLSTKYNKLAVPLRYLNILFATPRCFLLGPYINLKSILEPYINLKSILVENIRSCLVTIKQRRLPIKLLNNLHILYQFHHPLTTSHLQIKEWQLTCIFPF